MAYTTWTDDKGNTFSEPYIPEKIVGFHGIDPDLVGTGGGGGGSGIDDHEQLQNLLGGNSTGHYHVNADEYDKINRLTQIWRLHCLYQSLQTV